MASPPVASPDAREQPAALPPTGAQAVDRAAALLVRIVEAPAAQTFGALLASTDLPKSTTSRLLNALERRELVQRDLAGGFRPGPVLTRYAQRGGGTADLVVTAQPFLERLGAETGETVNLAVPGRGGVDLIAQVDSQYLLGAVNWVGLRVPAHCSALGKVFLAAGAVSLPPGRLERLTPATITSRTDLAAELDGVRRRGWAMSPEELEVGLVAVAAPVCGEGGAVIAAISVSGPSLRLTPERTDAVGAALARESRMLSTALGHDVNQAGAA